ncbi:MAG: class I adenylate-forming enzyme family protein [Myxococcota bacterium]|nr:class I adenylate-forming enzyme family protein [Myxococcota bacterium]
MTTWLPHPLYQAAQAHPNRIAIREGIAALTYGQLLSRVAARGDVLRASGVDGGAVVGLRGQQNLDWLINFHAIGWCNAAVFPIGEDLHLTDGELRELNVTQVIESRKQATTDNVEGTSEPVFAPRWHLDELRLLIATTGSTGRPKVIPLTTGQLFFSAMGSAIRLGHQLDDNWLMCLPAHHIGGASILLRAAWYGISAEICLPFEVHRVAERLRSGEVTMVSLVPTMLSRLVRLHDGTSLPSRLRCVLVGGAHCSTSLQDAALKAGLPVLLTWGMTECASQAATQSPGQNPVTHDCGSPMPFTVVSTEDKRLRIDGPTCPGGLLTRDLGDIENGRVRVDGRCDTVLISGGKKIQPQSVECIFQQHESINSCVIIGLNDEQWGQTVCLCVELNADYDFSTELEHLVRLGRSKLKKHEIPKVWVQVPKMPTNSVGKVDRTQLRANLGLDHADPDELVDELRWTFSRLESWEGNESVFLADDTTHFSVKKSGNGTLECNGSLSQALNLHGGNQTLASAHGLVKRRIGKDEGQTNSSGVENMVEVAKGSSEHFFETHVGILEGATIENDPGAVDLVESGREFVFEGHKQIPNGHEADQND